jgi:hypothetical protein
MFQTGHIDHPTFIHQLVWWDRICLTPLDDSIPGLAQSDPALIESCKSLHGAMRELLEDMYQHPDAYYLNPGEYEAFLNGRSVIEARRENREKHNQARSKCYWLAGFHWRFLMDASRCGEVTGAGLVMRSEDYAGVVKKAAKSPFLKGVDVNTRIAALSRAGFEVKQGGEGVVLTYPKAPEIFLAMNRLSRAGEADKTYGALNFHCCNFQQIEKAYIPDFPLVIHVLDEPAQRMAQRLNQYAARLKMTPKCYVVWKMNYSYKGQVAFRFGVEYADYVVHVNLGLNDAELAHFEKLIHAQPQEMQNFYARHLNVCKNCGYCENVNAGSRYMILGHSRRTCGFPALEITNPDEEQTGYIEKFIDLRLETIRAVK